jgi:hypothetical protein
LEGAGLLRRAKQAGQICWRQPHSQVRYVCLADQEEADSRRIKGREFNDLGGNRHSFEWGGAGLAVSRMGLLKTVSPHPKPDLKGIIMNIQKNMELIFVSTLAAVGVGSYALDNLPEAKAKVKPQVAVARNIATPTSMAVVIITAPKVRSGI